ncbi:MAG: hypothetical protein U0939_06020 [Pirellulales bacterium]
MIRATDSSTSPPDRTTRAGRVRASAGAVEVCAKSLVADPTSLRFRQFLSRAFAVADVHGVELNAGTGRVRIDYSTHERSRVLGELAEAMRAPRSDAVDDVRHLYLFPSSDRRVRVTRYDDRLSTWEVLHRIPGRLRVRHAALVHSRTALRHLASELTVASGVQSATANPRTGTLLVEFDENMLSGGAVLQMLERLLGEAIAAGDLRHRVSAADLWLATGNLALAAAADFFLPVLAPASAVAMVAINLPNIVQSAREIVRLRPGLATLYTTIVGCTLASGLFFPAALMGWFMRYWDRSHHGRFDDARRAWLRPFQVRARFAWRRQEDGTQVETPVESLAAGDVVCVRPGETMPVDGVVVAGAATLEVWDAGDAALHARPVVVTDQVLAGSRVRDGRLQVRVERAGEATRAGAIATLLQASTTPAPLSLKGHGAPFADKCVAPTLALAGLGFFVGDVTTSLAVLRPDYATGTGITATTGALHDVAQAVRDGIVLRSPAVLDQVREIDLVLWDYSPSAGIQEADVARFAHGIDQLRRQSHAQVGLTSKALSEVELQLLGERLGCEVTLGAARDEAPGFDETMGFDERLADFIYDCRAAGRRVALVGDCGATPIAAREAQLAVSTGDVARHSLDPAHVFLLNDDAAQAGRLWTLARERRNRRRWQMACTVAPNLACVAGAFALGFTGLHAVVLTNLGVFAAYQAGARWLRAARPTSEGA